MNEGCYGVGVCEEMLDFFVRYEFDKAQRWAIANERGKWNYLQLQQKINAVRKSLAAHNSMDRPLTVFIALPGGPEFTAVVLACLEENAVGIPIPYKSTNMEARQYVRVIDPDILFVESASSAEAILGAIEGSVLVVSLSNADGAQRGRSIATWEEMEAGGFIESTNPGSTGHRLPRELGMIQFTSGSTGMPKGIMISRKNITAYLENNSGFLETFATDSVFCPMPQCHAFGGTVVLEHIWAGSSIYVSNQFVPADDILRMREGKCGVIQC